jgi:hypothetical protein
LLTFSFALSFYRGGTCKANELFPGMVLTHTQRDDRSLRLELSSDGLEYIVRLSVVDPDTLRTVRQIQCKIEIIWDAQNIRSVSFHHATLDSSC